MATLEYFIEYDYGITLPGNQSAYIHLRLELPVFQTQISKEDYFGSTVGGHTDDETVPSDGGTLTQTFTPDDIWAFPGTITGTLYKRLGGSPVPLTDTQIQTFVGNWDGSIDFTDIGSPTTKAASGSYTVIDGRINITFNNTPGDPYYVVVSYDWAEGQPETDIPFVTGLFNISGVTELAIQSFCVWVMKSPLYSWDDVLPLILEYLRSSLSQDDIEELPNSGQVTNSALRRDLTE